jgi:predicted Zn-dependent protease
MMERRIWLFWGVLAMSMQAHIVPVFGASFSSAYEAKLGASLADEVKRKTTPVENPVQEYVQRIGGRVAAGSKIASRLWVVREDVGEGPTHEPLWLPGGYIIVPARLILAAANESELAGMLAHAIAHVENGDPMRTLEGSSTVIITLPLVFLKNWTATSSFQRLEFEADRRAVALMAAARYDAEALVAYLSNFVQSEGGPPIGQAPLEPLIQKRIATLRQVISASRATWEYDQVQESLRREMTRDRPGDK